MPNPLDPIWYTPVVSRDAFQVVRRAVSTAADLLTATEFDGLPSAVVLAKLFDAQADADERTVLFLYAAFESALRDHVAARAGLLAAAVRPTPQFGLDLQSWFDRQSQDARMDGITDLFVSAILPGHPTLPPVIGTVRKYRHWLAHGKRGRVPPAVQPQFAYASLSQFLQVCGLG